MAAPTRVVIIEDLREIRDGLTILINGTHGFACAAGYRTMEEVHSKTEAVAKALRDRLV